MASEVTFGISLCLLINTANAGVPAFSLIHRQGTVDDYHVGDASGLAASRKFPGILYTHNDRGDLPRLFAINESNAHVVAELRISGAYLYDWEDIAVGPCSQGDDRSCIYISDDGEENHRDERTIYRVIEPATMGYQTLAVDSILKFNWTEHGSKTIMVDPDANVYIISAIYGGRGMIVKLPSLAWGQPRPVFVESGSFLAVESDYHGNDPNAGDISPDGNEVIVKTVDHVYYWSVPGHDYLSALTHKGTILPTHEDHNGQGLCFAADGGAYYTLAEGRFPHLYKYTRL